MTGSIDDETELRALLRDVADVANASDDLFSRVRSGAARRRKARAAAGALALVVAVGGGVGGVLAAESSGGTASALHAGPLTCAASRPFVSPPPTAHAGLDKSLVPGSPIEGLVCIYASQPSARNALPLVKSQRLTGSTLAAVVQALQVHVEEQGPGGMFCPATSLSFMADLKFRYADGPDVVVGFSDESAFCRGWSNGVLSGSIGLLPPVLANLFPAR